MQELIWDEDGEILSLRPRPAAWRAPHERPNHQCALCYLVLQAHMLSLLTCALMSVRASCCMRQRAQGASAIKVLQRYAVSVPQLNSPQT